MTLEKMNTKTYLNPSFIDIRTKDVITGAEDLEPLFEFNQFPVQFGCTNAPKSGDRFADMNYLISRGSGCIQLGNLIDPKILYESSHSAGTTGQIWETHHMQFAKFLGQFGAMDIIEIGGSHAQLFKNYSEKFDLSSWTIVEPNPIAESMSKLNFIKDFFSPQFISKKKYEMAVHSHTLEHIYEPEKFLNKINSSLLYEGGIHCFSIPDIDIWFENKFTNAINFEHTFLITPEYIESLLNISGFKILTKHKFGNNHSTFYATQKVGNRNTHRYSANDNLVKNNRNLAAKYKLYLENEVLNINNQLLVEDKEIYIFGAHVFTQTLLNLGLHEDCISYILDNSIQKHGLRLYGANLYVKDPSIIANDINPIVIVRAGAYDHEIKSQLLEINPNVKFI
jgi:hypothetical protein